MIFSFSQPVWNDMLRGVMVMQSEQDYIILKFSDPDYKLPRPFQQRSVLIKNVVLNIDKIETYSKATWARDHKTAGDYSAIHNFLKNRNNHTTSDWNCIRNTCSTYDLERRVNNMPNHVRNVIKISKIKPEEIEMVLEMIATPMCAPAPVMEDADYIIDFDKIIPEPKFESECPDEYKVNKESRVKLLKDRPWFDWYKWHIDHWGTKWGAYDCYTKIGKSYIQFVFSTAWTSPMPIIYKLGILGYDINVKYADEDYGVNCGKLKYTSEQGWTHWNSLDMKDPERFARDLWNNY